MRGSGWGMICILLNECERERECRARNLSSMGRGGYLHGVKIGTGLRCGLQESRKRWLRLDSRLLSGVLFSVLQDTVLFSESWGLRRNLVFLLGVYDYYLIEKTRSFPLSHVPTFPLEQAPPAASTMKLL